jgi:hypothetical protein
MTGAIRSLLRPRTGQVYARRMLMTSEVTLGVVIQGTDRWTFESERNGQNLVAVDNENVNQER